MIPHYYLDPSGKSVFKVGTKTPVFSLENKRADSAQRTKTIFLIDRDGVIVEKPLKHQYHTGVGTIKLLPGAAEALSKINQKNIPVALVSNQPGISKNLFSMDDLLAMNEAIAAEIKSAGAHIDAVFFCPHKKPQDGEEACHCRKPEPGMLFAAMEIFNAKPARTYMFGDFENDILAAKKAGVHPVYIATRHDEYEETSNKICERHPEVFKNFCFDDLLSAVDSILAKLTAE